MTRCPICDAPLVFGRFMCRRHWLMVPRTLQADLYAAWHAHGRSPTRRTEETLRGCRSDAERAVRERLRALALR